MMTTMAHRQNASIFLDQSKPGSVWAQVLTGVVGIILCVVLIVGQLAVAITSGIQHNLHQSVLNLARGNQTMTQVLDKAQPVPMVEKVTKIQQDTLANTSATMVILNGQMAAIGGTTGGLKSTVDKMAAQSGSIATGVEGMDSTTKNVNSKLGGLLPATDKVAKPLGRIATDSTAINVELAAIAAKLVSYGLPAAQGVHGA